jgi:hypothetical protein
LLIVLFYILNGRKYTINLVPKNILHIGGAWKSQLQTGTAGTKRCSSTTHSNLQNSDTSIWK